MTDNQSPGSPNRQRPQHVQSNDDCERERFWKGVHDDYERLRADPVAWRDYQHDVAVFEGGSTDGLQDEEPYYSRREGEAIRGAARAPDYKRPEPIRRLKAWLRHDWRTCLPPCP